MNKYCILLSTYKNHEYLEELIESIELQTEVEWTVYWREDSNKINKILEEKGHKYIKCSKIEVEGKNLGVKNSFITLLLTAPTSDYYIFCDQDDIWNVTRLEQIKEIVKTKNNNNPMLLMQNGVRYAGGMEGSELIHKKIEIKNNILYDNPFPGCCMVLNHAGRILFLDDSQITRSDNILHDWLLINVAYTNKWENIIDKKIAFKYRIHSNNTIGLPGPFKKIKTLILDGKITNYVHSHAIILRNNLKYYKNKNKETKNLEIKIKALKALFKIDLIKAILLLPFIMFL